MGFQFKRIWTGLLKLMLSSYMNHMSSYLRASPVLSLWSFSSIVSPLSASLQRL